MTLRITPHESPALSPARQWVVGTPAQFQWVCGTIRAILILNLLDAILTLVWVQTGIAHEANPLLVWVVHHPLLFIGVKIALGSLGAWLLWQHRHRALAVIGTFSVFIAYYGVFIHHLSFATMSAFSI
jgi:hypothetical protein